uniref:Uncharacterized protein n=1 Tax=Nitzschia sp. (in: diatoms) TaxID=1884248 RepID=A0A5J6DUR3_9STRA|nr:hypothetical protein [Nitzschia sp. (in: diatoms)]
MKKLVFIKNTWRKAEKIYKKIANVWDYSLRTKKIIKLNNLHYFTEIKRLEKKFKILLKVFKENKSNFERPELVIMKSRLRRNVDHLYDIYDVCVTKKLIKKNKASKKKALFKNRFKNSLNEK